MEIIEEGKVVEKHGLAIRLIEDDGTYIVQQTPLNKDGTYDEEQFDVFGGTVGFSTSEFDSEEKARKFFNDVLILNKDRMAERYPEIWVS